MLEAANVSTVPQLSPFRYPGGKTWLIPLLRKWLAVNGGPNIHFVEPFAGGAIMSLTAVNENLVRRATLLELDEDVSTVWDTILSDRSSVLSRRIRTFAMN